MQSFARQWLATQVCFVESRPLHGFARLSRNAHFLGGESADVEFCASVSRSASFCESRIGRCGILRVCVSQRWFGAWRVGQCGVLRVCVVGVVCESVDNSAIGENRACCDSDISDMERNVVVTEHMERDVIVRHIESNVDVTSSTFIPKGNKRRTYFW